METGIECLGTSTGSSRLQTHKCLLLSNPERGGSLLWPCFGLGLLRAELNHLTLICNFQQLINLGFFQCPQAALHSLGCPDDVQVFGWWGRAGKILKLPLFPWGLCWSSGSCCLLSLGLKPDSSVADPGCCHPTSALLQVLWDCFFWGWDHCPALLASLVLSAWFSLRIVFSLLGSSALVFLMQASCSYSQGSLT